MNKVFKVIWNEARNAYVVVSEIAKNRGSKSCSTKKLLAMLIATGVMTCASFDVLAEEPMAAETAQSQYVAFYDETAGLINGQDKPVGGHKYIYDATNKYWVREGYVLVVEENGKLHTPLSANGKSADVLYIGGGDTGSILQSVASTVSANGTVTNMGESLNRITASAFAGVSHGGGTAVAGDWSYIIQDSSWKDKDLVASGNYKDGYADLIDKDNGMPKGFKTAEDPNTELNWDATKQAYTYKGKPVDYSNVYVINGKIGVFTNKDGSEVYKGTVFGKNNEILMTVKDANNKFYSYWASEVTDPSATMQSYRMAEYKKDLSVLEENDNKLHRDDIKEVTMTTDASTNSAIIGLVRNGNTEAGAPVKGAITVTSGGGTEGQDTFVKISNDTANQTFATGSKVEVTEATAGAGITGIKVNGVDYTIKQGSGVEVTQDTTKKTTTITVDGNETIITDTDTTYTAGNGIEINGGNAISVSKNLTGMQSITGAGAGSISFDGANVKVNNTTFSENSVVVGGGTDGKTPVTINGTDGVVSGLHNTNIGYTDFATKGNAATEEQLKKVMDAGWKFTTDSGTQTTVTVGEAGNEVKFNGDAANIDVTNTGKDIKVALKKDLTVDSVKAGETTVNTNGFTIGNGANGIVLNKTNVSMGGQQIHNVAAGTDENDAVNFGQLKETNTKVENLKVEAGRHTTLVKGENTTVEKIETADGHFEYKVNAVDTKYTAGSGIAIDTENNNAISVKLQDGSNLVVNSNGLALNTALIGIQSITGAGAGSISFNGGNVKVNQNTFNSDGRIQNVANGTETKDAVNFGQLQETNNKVDNLTTEVGKGWTVATENGTATKVGAGDTVKFSGDDDNIKVSNTGKDVKVELNKNLTVDSVKAGDFFMDKNNGIGYKGKAYITSSGLNANNQKITGVAAGTIAAGSTDAVNGSQLNDVKNSISNDISNKTFGLEDDKGNKATSILGNTVQVKGADGITSTVKDGALEIGLKLQDNSNLVVNSNGLALNTALTGIKSINGAGGTINLAGSAITINETTFNKDGRIQNVAAGTETKDAVNFGQLDATNKKVDNLTTEVGKGWTVATDNGTATKVGAGDTVKFNGDDNIKVSNDGKDVKVELNKKLTVDSVKAGDFFMDKNEGVGYKGKAYITSSGLNANGQTITNVKAGEAETDAVNVGQLNAVKAEARKKTTLSNGKNTTVTSVTTDGQTDYQVNVAGDLKDITSVANGASEIKLNADSIIIANANKTFEITNSGIGMSYVASDYSTKAIMLGEHGTTISGGLDVAGSKITGVAAGTANTDAVNVGQLNTVKNELQASDKHLVANTASADGSYKPDANGNISLRVEDQNKNGYDVVIKDVASKAELGEVANRVTNVENKVTQIETDVTNIKNDITNIQTDVTDIKTDITNINTRVDKVEALAGKHTTLEKNGTNINVEETEVDGHKNYKVNLNKDITLGDENGNNVSISGTNGTITATGDITTANRINAGQGGKLADIDVTGNKLSNGNSSITLDCTNVKVNDKVTVDKDGKISGVAKGDISNTSTDAVNGSQLYNTNTHITNVENQVISNSNRIGQLSSRVNKVGAGAAALAALHPMDFDPDDKLTFSAGYGNYAGQNAAAIGAYYRPDEKVMFSVAGTVGNGENMVNAGVSFALDRTNHVSNSRTALAREVIDLRGQLAVMGAKMAKMEKAFGMLDETKTKLFPDVPANHWAYEYIAKLAGNGYIEGYPDGNFGGDRLMTRYEFASMLYRAIENGAALEERIIKEFEPELGRIRVDRISGEDGDRNKIERVRVNATKGERDHYGNKLK